jgi:NAD(P)-dependent dehydrogenase (short-subunit alcohol dehydrogenase family)
MTRALVTGGASGIGLATVLELTARGHDVWALDLDGDALAAVPAAGHVVADITDHEAAARAAARLEPLDILVNNAGVSVWGTVEDTPIAEQRRLFEILYHGPMNLIHAVLPGMRERGTGVIVNVTSVSGRATQPMLGPYSAAKAALDIVTESLAHEVGHFGVRVVSVAPGRVRTNIGRTRRRFSSNAYRELARQVEAGAAAMAENEANPPETVARVIADAISDTAPRIRYAGSPDAAAWWRARDQGDDAAFRHFVWEQYQLTW